MSRLPVVGLIILAGIDSNGDTRPLLVTADGSIDASAEEPPLS